MDAHTAANQSMNCMYRGTPLPLLMAAMEEFPIPAVPAEINMDARRGWFLAFNQLVINRESIAEIIRQCIGWIHEWWGGWVILRPGVFPT